MTPIPLPVAGEPDGARPAQWYAATSARRDVLLVLAHGAGAGQSHPFIVRYAAGLAARGIDVVTFDFPYVQAGRKAPDRAPVLEDAFRRAIVSAAAHAAAAGSDGTGSGSPRPRLVIGGKSMGGRMATHVAAAHDAWPVETPLAAVVVFGYPLNPPGGPSRRSPDRTSHLTRITVPLLVVQGTRDTFGGPDAVRAAMPNAQVHAVTGADHSPAAKYDQEIFDVVETFVSST